MYRRGESTIFGSMLLILIVVAAAALVIGILFTKGSSIFGATTKVSANLELQPLQSFMQTGSLLITTGKPIAIQSIMFEFYNSSRLVRQTLVINTGIRSFKEVQFNFTASGAGPVARIEGGQFLDNIVEKSAKFTFNIVYNSLDVTAVRVVIYYYTSDGKIHHVTTEITPIS